MKYLAHLLRFSVAIAVVWAAVPSAVCLADETPAVRGADIVAAQYAKIGDTVVFGGFFKMDDGSWLERNDDGIGKFTEAARDEWSVILVKSDGAQALIDNYTKKIRFKPLINGVPAGEFQPLYDVVRVYDEPVVVGHNLTSMEVKSLGGDKVIGGFAQTGDGSWLAFKDGETNRLTENRRDEWSVYLSKDDGAEVALDLYQKKVKLKNAIGGVLDAAFHPIYDMSRAYNQLPGDGFVREVGPATIKISNLRVNGLGLAETESQAASLTVSFDYQVFVRNSEGAPDKEKVCALHLLLQGGRGGSGSLLKHAYGEISGSSGTKTFTWPKDSFGELPAATVYLVNVITPDPITSYAQSTAAAAGNPRFKIDPGFIQRIKLAVVNRPPTSGE